MPVTTVRDESELKNVLKLGGHVVVGFLDRSDKTHEDHLSRLSEDFELMRFCKVDADGAGWFAQTHSVDLAPAILIFDGEKPVIKCSGDNILALEQKLKILSKKETEARDPDPIDLVQQALNREKSFCLNESESHPLSNCLAENETVLKSDLDQKLIISLTFRQLVRIHSVEIKCPVGMKLGRVRFFINRSESFDFDEADSSTEVEMINFAGVHGLQELPNLEHKIVQSLAICLDTDEYGVGTTEIQQLKIYGLPFKLITDEAFKKPDPEGAGSKAIDPSEASQAPI